MRTYYYKSLGELAGNINDLTGAVGFFRIALLHETLNFLDIHSRREPVFTGKHKDRTGGELKASRRVVRTPTGEGSSIGWDVPWARVIDRGRKRSKPYRRVVRALEPGMMRGRRGRLLGGDDSPYASKEFTRMLGSKQARGGMTRPAGVALRRDWEKVVSIAILRSEEAA